MDWGPPGCSIHGISKARILGWVATSFSRGIFPSQGLNPHLLALAGKFFATELPGKPKTRIYFGELEKKEEFMHLKGSKCW